MSPLRKKNRVINRRVRNVIKNDPTSFIEIDDIVQGKDVVLPNPLSDSQTANKITDMAVQIYN